MKTVSIEDLIRWEACKRYIIGSKPTEITLSLFDGRETLSTAEVARLDICLGDRLWVLAHVEIAKAVEFARTVVEKALNYVWLYTGIKPLDGSWGAVERCRYSEGTATAAIAAIAGARIDAATAAATKARDIATTKTTANFYAVYYSARAALFVATAYLAYIDYLDYDSYTDVGISVNAIADAVYAAEDVVLYNIEEERANLNVENELKAIFHY